MSLPDPAPSKPPHPLRDLDVLILAGGLGTRLRSALPDRQKVLAPVAGRPFMDRLIHQVVRQGARHLVFALGYHADQVITYLKNLDLPGVTLTPSVEEQPLGTAGAIRYALPHLKSDPVVVMNGDSIAPVDFPALVDHYHRHRAQIAMALTRVADAGRYGSVGVNDRGQVVTFQEKQTGHPTSAVQPGLINAGVYLLARQVIEAIPAGRLVSLERELFPRYCSGGAMVAVEMEGLFLDIGTPESFTLSGRLLADT